MRTEISLAPEIMSSVEHALREDIGAGDATTNRIVPAEAELAGVIIAKKSGVIAGLAIAEAAFRLLDAQVRFTARCADGDGVPANQVVAEINGSARAILTAERTALNFLGRMSGIASRTREFVDAVEGTKTKILDTRKTAPNLSVTDKLAVRLGGGQNHRFGLFDMILIKDNHIDFAGSISRAVTLARADAANLEIEVETRTLADVAECLDLGVKWIMLDNMSLQMTREAVAMVDGRAKLEASGNVTLRTVRQIAETGVDYISVGGLTHSVEALDVSLQVKR